MFDDHKAAIDRARRHFEEDVARRSPSARESADTYMRSLERYLDAFGRGPAADPHVAGLDTTGAINETEDYAEWAWRETRRVRDALAELPE